MWVFGGMITVRFGNMRVSDLEVDARTASDALICRSKIPVAEVRGPQGGREPTR